MNFKNRLTAFFSSTKRVTSIMIALMAFSMFLYIDAYNDSFVFDEAYTMAMIQNSFSDIWDITAMDVHPPLYYFMLKCFVFIFGDSLLSLRIFSNLGILGVFLLGMFPIRRYFGASVSMLFVFLIAILPVTQFLADEIRMYSWSMFFTLSTAIAAYQVFRNSNKSNNSVLLLTALCASYTHYFSLLATFVIFGLLLLFLILEKKRLNYTIIALIFFLIGYSFWIPELLHQFITVNNSHWVGKLTLKDLLLFSYYIFCPKDPTHPYTLFTLPAMAVALSCMLLILTAIASITIRGYKKLNKNKMVTSLLFMSIFFIPVTIAIIVSYITNPIMIPRYMTCLLGCLVLGISILLTEVYNSKISYAKTLIWASIFILSVLSVTRFYSEKEYMIKSNKEYAELKRYFNGKNTGKTVFISPFSTCGWLGMLSVMYPSNENLYLVYSEKKTSASYKPFRLMEINTIPIGYDFHYTEVFENKGIRKKATTQFTEKLKKDYVITDSLVQKTDEEIGIYLMKTIHREREKQLDIH